MTNEQTRVLNHHAQKTINYEQTNEQGEILNQQAKVNAEPHFVKLYYDTFLAFKQIKDVPAEFLAQLGVYMQYVDRAANSTNQCIVHIGKVERKTMAKNLNVTDVTINRYIDKAKKAGILLPYIESGTRINGYFITNPYIIAKGEWEGIKKLRANIDFLGGEWTLEMETEIATDSENNVSKGNYTTPTQNAPERPLNSNEKGA